MDNEKEKNIIGEIKVTQEKKEDTVVSFIWGFIKAFFIVIMVVSVISAFSTTEVYREGGKDRIALLHVSGTIMESSEDGYNHGMLLDQLETVFEDEDVKAVIIQLDTPGGGVIESEEVHKKIKELQAKYNKPYIAYMNSMAASGGYYIAAPADKIVANKNTLTGSIGVIMSSLNIGGLLEDYGVKMEVIKSGEHKDIMSAYKEVSDEEREIMQSIVDEIYGYFVDVVVEGRDMPREEVLKIADGRVYSAKQAKDLKLVDEIGDLDFAIDVAEDLAEIENATVIEYYQIATLSSLSSIFNKDRVFAEIGGPSGLKINLDDLQFKPMYLYSR